MTSILRIALGLEKDRGRPETATPPPSWVGRAEGEKRQPPRDGGRLSPLLPNFVNHVKKIAVESCCNPLKCNPSTTLV